MTNNLPYQRNITKIPVNLPAGVQHKIPNTKKGFIQREIIEEFLPRFGKGCEVLYIGDTSHKILHINEAQLEAIGFFKLMHDELPDIVAFNKEKNWLYLIEAVHSGGPISEIRRLELKKLLHACTAELIFITAFISKQEYAKWAGKIAWETEVWMADNPDHMIHFNGNKFMGPYLTE
ncbi:hypothetical protein BH10BAC3_BH10BAC3_05990 [soil metagenome]